MRLDQIEPGTWLPKEKGFVHECPICKERFIGRKNKVYCSQSCKTRKATDVASARNALIPKSRIMIKCAEALEAVYPMSQGKKWIPYKKLLEAGYVSSVPTEITKRDDFDGTLKRLGYFEFAVDRKNKKIIIFKIK